MRKILGLLAMTVLLIGCDDQIQNNDLSFTLPTNSEVSKNDVLESEIEVDLDTIDSEDVESDNTDSEDPENSFNELMKSQLNPELYNYDQTVITIIENPNGLFVMGNKINQLPSDFVPAPLTVPNVTFSFAGSDQKKQMVDVAATALEILFEAALEDDLKIVAVSGYRSFERQQSVYAHWVNLYGEEEADKFSARPGHSEHQTGLTMDVSCASLNYQLEYELGDLPEGLWLKEHAHDYGFIIRYPEDKVEITGYNYEPWHLRYVGVELATYLYEHNLSLEEYYQFLLN